MIEAVQLAKRYDKNQPYVLKDVNFKVERGEFVFIVGQSGAGKSTLLKLLIREILPTSGTLKIFGQDLRLMPERRGPYLRRNIGMVFQDFRLLEERTAYENVAFAMQVTGAVAQEIARRVPAVLEMVGLGDKLEARVCDLSGGEQQRIGLARAIVNRPSLILADEPTGNLDPDTSMEIINLLRNINIRGTTVLVATHDREIVDRMQKRVIHLEHGQIAGDQKKGVYARAF